MNKLDCRKLECPEPVIRTKKELGSLKEGELLEVLVDNFAAVENVSRYAQSQSCKATSAQIGNDFVVSITKGVVASSLSLQENAQLEKRGGGVILFIKSAVIGSGDDELGRVLMTAFFNTAAEYEQPPKKIFFVNGGVKLTAIGSGILPALEKLAGKGVEIYSCGTCLDFYGLREKLSIGKVGNMYELISNLFSYNIVYL